MTDDVVNKYFDHEMNLWFCADCNRTLRSDGECTTRECAAKNELKRLGIDRG